MEAQAKQQKLEIDGFSSTLKQSKDKPQYLEWIEKFRNPMINIQKMFKLFRIKVCAFNENYVESAEMLFNSNSACAWESDIFAFMRKIVKCAENAIINDMHEFRLRTEYKYAKLFAMHGDHFEELSESLRTAIHDKMNEVYNDVMYALDKLHPAIDRLRKKLSFHVELSDGIRRYTAEIVKIIKRSKKTNDIEAQLKPLKALIEKNKSYNFASLSTEIRIEMADIENCITTADIVLEYLPETLEDYFEDEPHLLFNNPIELFDHIKVMEVEDNLKKLRTSVTEFRGTLKSSKDISRQTKFIDKLWKLWEDDELIMKNLEILISKLNLKAIEHFKKIFSSNEISGTFIFESFSGELSEFFDLIPSFKLSIESDFMNNRCNFRKDFLQLKKENILRMEPDEGDGIYKIVSTIHTIVSILKDSIKSKVETLNAELIDLVFVTEVIQNALSEMQYILKHLSKQREEKYSRFFQL